MKQLLILITLVVSFVTTAQVKIGNNPTVLNGSALLELESTTQGFLPPRLTSVQRDNITTPVVGLLIYNLDTKCINLYTGTSWYDICSNTPPEGSNMAPVVNAGDDQTITTDFTTLDGSATDSDGTVVSVVWSQLSGPSTAQFDDSTAYDPFITDLVVGEYQFMLTATDDGGVSGFDMVIITVMAENQPPLVEAGPDQSIDVDNAFVEAVASDPDGTIDFVQWYQVSGPNTAVIETPYSLTTNITGLVEGTYQFEISVNDNEALTTQDFLTIVVDFPNVSPVVFAGDDQTIDVDTASLSGTATDSDGTIVSTVWTQTAGTAATIDSPNSLDTAITGLSNGTYEFTLTATDNEGAVATDVVTIEVAILNLPPDVYAGDDQTILVGDALTLTGTASDADGTIASVIWTQNSGPNTATITTPGSLTTSVTNLVSGTYVFDLTATDNDGDSASSSVTIVVQGPNVAPVANAGINKTVAYPSTSTNLDGSASYDSDGTIVTYLWEKISGYAGAGTIVSPSASTTTITNLVAGVYVFRLTVTDDDGATNSATVAVYVNRGSTFTTAFGSNAALFSTNGTCSNEYISTTGCGGNTTVTDAGYTYDLVEINGQCWFEDNVQKPYGGSPYYSNAAGELAQGEGRLYTWQEALAGGSEVRGQGVCPTGWHVPSDCEYMFLEHGLGMNVSDQTALTTNRGAAQNVGTQLKPGGSSNWNGLYAGAQNPGVTFFQRGAVGFWWTSSSSTTRYIGTGDAGVNRSVTYGIRFSVRCLKD